MLPDREQYPYFHWPISHAQSSKKKFVGEMFQKFLAFSILSWKIGNSKPQLVLLNPYIIIPWGSQLTISDKKAFSYTFNRVKNYIHTVLLELILRLGICLHSSHLLSAEGQVAISLIFRGAEQFQLLLRCQGYLRGKKPTFITRQTRRQQTIFPKTLLCESPWSCTELQPRFSRV